MNPFNYTAALTKDATQFSKGAVNLVSFDIVHNDDYKDKEGNWIKRPTWFTCKIFTKDQESAQRIVQRLKKGVIVYVSGIPKATCYINKEGKPIASIEVIVNDWKAITFVDNTVKSDKSQVAESSNELDDLPW